MKNCAGLVLLVSSIASAPHQAPVRDPHPATAGAAATVSGRVIDDRGTPLPGAVVYLIGGGPPGARTAITAEDGRFAWTGVDPALYTLAASKGGYPPIEYGQTRSGGPGTPMQIEAGARLTLDIRMPRGAVIAGVVLDEDGQPVAGRQITVLRASAPRTSARQGSYLSSDPRGRYRVFGLRADTYRVTTGPISSAGDIAHSVIVTVAAGEERDGIDLSIAPPVQTTRLTVSATAADGQPLGPLQVQLRRPGDARSAYSYGTVNADGSRTLSDVAAGRYRVFAQANPPRGTTGQPSSTTTYWGGAEVSVEGDRPASVAVTLTPGVRIRGQIAFAGGPRPSTRGFFVHLAPVDLDGLIADANNSVMGSIALDGAFTLTGVPPGRYLLQVMGGSETKGWELDSVKVGDIDAADLPFEVGRSDIADVAITMTDAKSWLRGRLTSASGAPLNRADLIVFPMQIQYRTRASRRVLTTRTDMDGRFEVGGLPAGSYGIAIVDEIDRDALQDPVFLAKLRPVSTLTLHRGETLTHDIVVPR